MQPSVMKHDFSRIPGPRMERSSFDRSHGHKTTFDAAYLVPFWVDEILPGDTISLQATMFARLATPVFPVMDNLFLDSFYFFVPNRLIWNHWEAFQGAQANPGDTIDYEVPVVEGDPFTVETGELWDYFGMPLGTYPTADLPNNLHGRAYNLIYNEWFRDENLQDSVVVDLDDGPDDHADYVLLKRGKRHDYFTSCLPSPQKGDAIALPLGTTAPVYGTGIGVGFTNGVQTLGLYGNNGDDKLYWSTNEYDQAVGSAVTSGAFSGTKVTGITTDPTKSGMAVDLSLATAATVNQLREAFAFQKILENDNRGGTRYTEHLKARWGMDAQDYRLQRPEYLGGSSQRIDISGVPQTSSTDATSPQGNLAAYGVARSQSGFTKTFVEHGVVIGIVNVRSDITYQQGLDRMWSRRTRFDFAMPETMHLGEQSVLNKELYFQNDTAANNLTFGYQERWAEMRYKRSFVTGLMRTAAAGTLDRWHLATSFSGLPLLDANFIEDAPPIERIVAVTSEPDIIMDSYIRQIHVRQMPTHSVPGLMDRF